MRTNWRSLFLSLAVILVWTSCTDNVMDGAELSDAAAGKSNNPKSQSIAGDYNVSLATNGYTFTYTITKNPGAKNLGHYIVDLDNCGDQSPHLASVLSATVTADGVTTDVALQNSEGWGTGCSPGSTNFVKFDNLPAASVLELAFTLDSKYGKASSTGWLKAGTSCNSTTIEAPGCPTILCVYGIGHFFSNGSGAWPYDVSLGGFTYNKTEGQALFYGGNDSNVALKAFFRYASLALNGSLGDAPQDAITAIETYFSGNANKLTQANINLGYFSNSGLGTALSTLNDWIEANKCQP